jgi:hypothetical protein
LLDDNCDIAFVKEATMECPTNGVDYCKTRAEAACTAASNCDSKSVYERMFRTTTGTVVNNSSGYAAGVPAITVDGTDATTVFSNGDNVYKADGTHVGVVTTVAATTLTFSANTLNAVNDNDALVGDTPDTYVRVKGYGVDVPAHVVVGRGMTDAFKTIVGAKLAGSSYTAGTDGSGAWFHGHNGKSLTDQTSVASVADVIGTSFTAIMRDIPFFYEKNGLARPSDQVSASWVEISGANSVAGPVASAVAIVISSVAFLASHF